MLNIFAKSLDPERILHLQNKQYSEKLLLEDEVPAGESKLGKVSISSLGHFYCLYITGHFSTMFDNAGQNNDDGVSHLRGQLSDGSNQRPLFNDFVPLDLFCTPGRKKDSLSATVTTDPLGDNLFYPQPFPYMFTVNSEILFNVKNDSDVANNYALLFHGVRFPTAARSR